MLKIIARIVVILFLVTLLLALFAPSILSTNFGKNALFKTIKNLKGYDIQSESLKLRWMQGQSAEKIEIRNKAGKTIFQADRIDSTATLWKVLFYHDVGHLAVQKPFVVIEPPEMLTSKLTAMHAGFSLAVTIKPSMQFLGEVSATQGAAEFVTPGLQPVYMKEVQLDAVLLPQQIKILTSGLTQDSSGQGTFQIDLLAYPGTDQIDANLKLTNFPLRAADQIVSILHPQFEGVLLDTIGESFNADFKLKNIKESLELFLKANSDRFSADLVTRVQGDTLQLAAPALIQLQLPARSFEKLTSLAAKNSVFAQIKIDQLSIPLEHREQLSVQGTLKSDGLQLNEWTVDPFTLYVGSGAPSEWNVKVDSPQVQFQGSLHLPEQWEQLSFSGQALLPKNTKLDIKADSLQSIAIILQGDQWKGRFKGAFDPYKKAVTLLETGYLTVEFAQLPPPLPALLSETLPVQVTVDPTTIYLEPFRGQVKGKARAPAFQMGTSAAGETNLQFTGDLKTKNVQFAFDSSINKGPFNAEGSFIYPSEFKVTGSCTNLPVSSLQPFITDGPALLPLIGNSLTTNFQAELSPTSNFLKLSMSTPLLSLSTALKGAGKSFTLLSPINFVWTLTPEGYNTLATWLKGSATYALSQPATLKGSIPTLSFDKSFEYEAQITSDGVSFTNGQQSNTISKILINLSHPQPEAPHQFQLSAVAAPQGKLQCQGSFNPPGTADIKLLLEQFPSATFDLFTAPFAGNLLSLSAMCGPVLNLSLNTKLSDWNGPLNFELNSANLRSSMKGLFTSGTFTLADAFHLQMNITPELSHMLSHGTASYRSTGPVTFMVAPEGFSCPVSPFNFSTIQVGAAKLELGKLLCRNQGNIQTTLGLLKNGHYNPGDDVELWFAPFDFQITNGIVNYERTEILFAKEFQVCTWGTVDLPNDSIDATLGLTASCLKNAFGIPNLSKSYVLQIPVRGSLSDIEIDKGKATSKIGSLMLWQQKGNIAGGFIGGPFGKIIGKGIDTFVPAPGSDDKAPPPKKPFPWDRSEQETSDASHEHSKHLSPDDSALKQVLKLIR